MRMSHQFTYKCVISWQTIVSPVATFVKCVLPDSQTWIPVIFVFEFLKVPVSLEDARILPKLEYGILSHALNITTYSFRLSTEYLIFKFLRIFDNCGKPTEQDLFSGINFIMHFCLHYRMCSLHIFLPLMTSFLLLCLPLLQYNNLRDKCIPGYKLISLFREEKIL